MFRRSLLIFIRRIPIALISIFQIAFICYQVYYQLTNYISPVGHILWFLEVLQTYCLPIFIMSIFISYEYIQGLRASNIEESIAGLNFGKLKLYLYPILVLVLKSFFIFLVMLIFPLIVAVLGDEPLEMIFHIILTTSLNTFLTQIVASLIGALIAIKFRRVISYILMTIISLVFFGAFTPFVFHLSYFYRIHIWGVYELITKLLPPSALYGYDYQYGADIELQQWNLAVFWILLILTLIFILLLNKKSRKNLIVISLSAAFCLSNLFYIGTSSHSLSLGEINLSNGAFWENFNYYENKDSKNSEAEFHISSYDMQFNFDRVLHAKVVMDINSTQNLGEYNFTLYHGYKISSLKDENGQDLEYIRDGDYFTVMAEKELEKIALSYSGFSHLHYSNEQAVSLPGCFPYYPWAGFYPIYSNGFTAINDLPHSDFTVKLSGNMRLFTNLSYENEIHKGNTDALTIMGGFLEKAQFSKYDVIIQSYESFRAATQESFFEDLQAKITELETTYGLDSNINLQDYRFFIGNDTLINRTYYKSQIIFDNHIIIIPIESRIDDQAEDIIFMISGKKATEEAFYNPYNLNIGG